MMSRIATTFARCRESNRSAFVAYLCAGDPDFDTSLRACRALIESGIDVLELGMPFSDPLADGLTNQLASQRALASGMTVERVFDLVTAIRQFSEIPIVLYCYYNLVFSNGVEAFATAAKNAGVDGLLTLDLPPEEAGELRVACDDRDLETVFIVAPTTPDERLSVITEAASGFIYYVSREGVTGVGEHMSAHIPEAIERIKERTTLPVVVGFGISNREHVEQIAACADGVVVGSALVNIIREHLDAPDEMEKRLRGLADSLIAGTGRA